MSYSTSLLRQAYRQGDIADLQLLAKYTPRYVAQLVDEGERVYESLSTISEMHTALKAHLRANWRTYEHCTRDNQDCLTRRCGCSYADLQEYIGLTQTKRRLDRRLDTIARECGDIRHANSYVLWGCAARLLDDPSYVARFGAQLLANRCITRSQHTLMLLPGFFHFSGSIHKIVLEFGTDPKQIVELNAQNAPYYIPTW